MILDTDVNLVGLHPAMALIALCVDSAFHEHGHEARVSNGGAVRKSDRPGRKTRSLHPLGCALDFGLAHVPRVEWDGIANLVKERVRAVMVDVVYEPDAAGGGHLHVELDP